jgi:DNA-binding MarR family transcriptional regulator
VPAASPSQSGKTSAKTRATKKVRTNADAVGESVSIWFRLLSCHAVMLSKLRRELEDRTTLARFDLLASLAREDGQTLAGLSRALLVTAGNVTGLVDRAERDGVVERRPEPTDRRVARVWLTAEGRALIRDLLPLHARHVHELIGGLSHQDRRELRRLLGGLRDQLQRSDTSQRTNP